MHSLPHAAAGEASPLEEHRLSRDAATAISILKRLTSVAASSQLDKAPSLPGRLPLLKTSQVRGVCNLHTKWRVDTLLRSGWVGPCLNFLGLPSCVAWDHLQAPEQNVKDEGLFPY